MSRTAAVLELEAALGAAAVLWAPEDLLVYEYDGTIDRASPDAIAFPATAAEVAQVMRIANRHDLPVTPRGAGTGLSGGALAARGGVVVALNRMRRILAIDVENRTALVEPGVVNLDLGDAVAPHGLAYVPDPSSQRACTIGGNIAENAGGPHTLAYGATTNHVLGLELVTAEGEIQWLGGPTRDTPGYDLLAKCTQAVTKGDVSGLTKQCFEKALDSAAKAYGEAEGLDFHEAYAQVLATPFGSQLYQGYVAAGCVRICANRSTS